jgi:hypothetical protein
MTKAAAGCGTRFSIDTSSVPAGTRIRSSPYPLTGISLTLLDQSDQVAGMDFRGGQSELGIA